ncbi:aminotransferase [ANME-1 cluster archaeon GoMg4]|nr:aminotransferase [ANME-1 cluster archaeon GoMg4]
MVKPRAALRRLRVCEHGGKREASAKIIDFSVNLNPYGPPDFVSEAIQEAIEEIHLYPDTECRTLREQIAEKFGCEKNEVLVGAGVSELIQLVALAFVKNRVLMPEHTYGEYEIATKMLGAQIKRVEMPDLRINPELIVQEMKTDDVVFLCNPNNPTGQYLDKNEVAQILEAAERVDALVVIDEAYMDFVTDAFWAHKFSMHNLIILRSLTKSFAIPGVRVGYAISSEEIITELEKIKVPWSVSVCAQKVGAAVVGTDGDKFLVETRARIERSKRKIEKSLDVHTDANFYIIEVGDAREVKEELLKHGILVRDCTSFGLPTHIRFSVRKDEENDLLMHHLSKELFKF